MRNKTIGTRLLLVTVYGLALLAGPAAAGDAQPNSVDLVNA